MKWILFNAVLLGFLLIDLSIVDRRTHEIKFKEALSWSLVWISLALLFNTGLYFTRGPQKALEFFTGYLLEYSLSVDNLFVFILIFSYFRVESRFQHKILFWGIIGAIFMRALFIVAGVALIHQFHWIIYLFGAFLVFTGIKMAFQKEEEVRPENNIVLRLFKKFFAVSPDHEEGKFFVKRDSRWMATTLFVVLLAVETTDVLFATDSIPAILAISHDPFIVYTSNMFAILGLRSLYFALSGLMKMFHHLGYGLSAVLTFIGIKMLVSDFYAIPIGIALGAIVAILGTSILASLLFPKRAQTS